MRELARVAAVGGLLTLAGCQSFGVFSQPRTVPEGTVRLGAAVTYHDFTITGERQQTADFDLACQVGLSSKSELDFLAYSGGIESRLKHNFLGDGAWDLSVSSGLGLFSAFSGNTSSAYIPLDLVGGYRVTDDVSVFLGPKLYGAVSLTPPGVGAGFNDTSGGLLAGGVVGVAMESHRGTVVPQIQYMAPLTPGASGQVVQFVLGLATDLR